MGAYSKRGSRGESSAAESKQWRADRQTEWHYDIHIHIHTHTDTNTNTNTHVTQPSVIHTQRERTEESALYAASLASLHTRIRVIIIIILLLIIIIAFSSQSILIFITH